VENEVAGGGLFRTEMEAANHQLLKGGGVLRREETHVELMLEEQPSRMLVVVRVDETEDCHHSNRRCEKSEKRLPLERSSESMEERNRGGDEEDGEDPDELENGVDEGRRQKQSQRVSERERNRTNSQEEERER